MADLTSSNVRVVSSWDVGTRSGKHREVKKKVEIYDYTGGGATNKITAAALGLVVINEVHGAYNRNAGGAVTAVEDHDGKNVFLYPTPNGTTAPADQTMADTPNGLYFTIQGEVSLTK